MPKLRSCQGDAQAARFCRRPSIVEVKTYPLLSRNYPEKAEVAASERTHPLPEGNLTTLVFKWKKKQEQGDLRADSLPSKQEQGQRIGATRISS